MLHSWMSGCVISTLIGLIAVPAFARSFPGPDEIDYTATPGLGHGGNATFLEWGEKSSTTPDEPVVPATLSQPPGLHVRWLGTAGYEIGDGESTILIDPFFSRPEPDSLFLLRHLSTDPVPIDKYLVEPMGPRGLERVKAILISHTHHDHVQDTPYIVSRFPKAANRPVVVGDPNVAALLKLYDNQDKNVPWLRGVDNLSQTPQKIIEFKSCDKRNPPPGQSVAYPIGNFGNFKVTAFLNEHSLYDFAPVAISGPVFGEPPMISINYLAYLNSSMTYLIDYAGPQGKFRILVTDSARYANEQRVAAEIARGGRVDLLLQGIASRRYDNHIVDRIQWAMPRYLVPTHYDNFFKPLDQFQVFDYEIKFPSDYADLRDFIENFCGPEVIVPCPKLRMTKLFYYYSLNSLFK